MLHNLPKNHGSPLLLFHVTFLGSARNRRSLPSQQPEWDIHETPTRNHVFSHFIKRHCSPYKLYQRQKVKYINSYNPEFASQGFGQGGRAV
eukprot:3123871-Rhodomonas_salina.1